MTIKLPLAPERYDVEDQDRTRRQIELAFLRQAREGANTYTKEEVDALLAQYALLTSVYTRAQVDALLTQYALLADVYTRAQVDAIVAGLLTQAQADARYYLQVAGITIEGPASDAKYTRYINTGETTGLYVGVESQTGAAFGAAPNAAVLYSPNRPFELFASGSAWLRPGSLILSTAGVAAQLRVPNRTSGTNQAGTDLILSPGGGTGNAAAGKFLLSLGLPDSASGSTLHTFATVLRANRSRLSASHALLELLLSGGASPAESPSYKLSTAAGATFLTAVASVAGAFISGSAVGDACLVSSQRVRFSLDNGATAALDLHPTLATFIPPLAVGSTSSTGSSYTRYLNAGDGVGAYFGLENSTGTAFGVSPYAAVVYCTGRPFEVRSTTVWFRVAQSYFGPPNGSFANIQTPASSGTDKPATDLRLSAGQGTGTGRGGRLSFYLSIANATSGAAAHATPFEVFRAFRERLTATSARLTFLATGEANEGIAFFFDPTGNSALRVWFGVSGFSDDNFSGAVAGDAYWISSTRLVLSADRGSTVHLAISPTAATFAVPVLAPASSTSRPSIRLPHGTAPSAPADGDMWTTSSGLFVQINGVTRQVSFV